MTAKKSVEERKDQTAHWKQLIDILEKNNHMGYSVAVDFVSALPKKMETTFPNEWIKLYKENFYMMHDPVVLWGLQNDGVKNWNQLSLIFAGAKFDLISRARAYGFLHGTCIATTLNRRKSIVGMTHTKPDLPQGVAEQIQCSLAAYMIKSETDEAEHNLTPKQVQVVSLLAQGLTQQEIAERMHQKGVRPVQDLEKRLCERLGARTTAQAVLIAYRNRVF